MSHFFPYLVSFVTGHFLLNLLLPKKNPLSPGLRFFLAAGLGLSVNVGLLFLALIVMGQVDRAWMIGLNVGAAGLAAALYLRKPKEKSRSRPPEFDRWETAGILVILACLGPLMIYAQLFHPYGGWDAWQVWNFKAKFLFLGGENWQNLFNPVLWRSSPHYPLFLPLVNVWAWISVGEPAALSTFLIAIVFTFLTTGLLFTALKNLTGHWSAIVPPLTILSSPFFGILATSQYCDIVIGYYLLAAGVSLLLFEKTKLNSFAFLAGLFLGTLTFTKPEGAIAAFLMAFWFLFYKILTPSPSKKLTIVRFLTGLFINALPFVLFTWLFAPINSTFINGWTSASHPADMTRLKTIFVFFWAEISNFKYAGLWLTVVTGFLVSLRYGLRGASGILPLFTVSYLVVLILYYHINTHFEILSWMQNTLNRLLFAILPLLLFWIFASMWRKLKDA